MSSRPSSSLPILHHQYIAMVYVYQRLFIYSMILPIAIVVIPIFLRIIYLFLTLCVIGVSKTEDLIADDGWVLATVTMTILLTHVFTTKFLSLQSYLHSFSSRSNLEIQSRSSLSSATSQQTIIEDNTNSDDGDNSKTSRVEKVTSKENSNVNHENGDTVKQVNHSDTSNDNSSTTELKASSQHPKATMATSKYDVTSEQGTRNKNFKITNDHKSNLSVNTEYHISSRNYATTTIYLSIVVFLLLCALARYIRHWNGNDHPYLYSMLFPNPKQISSRSSSKSQNLLDYLLPSFMATLRLSLSMIICAFMMALRFFGPASIMRLSIVPLASNPWDRAAQTILYDIRQAFNNQSHPIMSERQHQQNARDDSKPPFEEPQRSIKFQTLADGEEIIDYIGRRYERPTMYSIVQQIVISLMASVTVAYVGFSPQYVASTISPNPDNIQLVMLSLHIASCSLTSIGSFFTILDGTSHEINPYLYTNTNNTIWFRSVCTNITSRVLYTTILVPIASMMIAAYMLQWDVGLSFTRFFQMYWILLRNCAGMSLYLYTYDEMIRTSLFHPRPNVSKMIRQWSNDPSSSTVTQLGIILNSLIGDSSLVQEIFNVTYSMARIGACSFEKEELFSFEKYTKQMAHILLSPTYNYVPSEAPLEEDVLRIVLLEAFGGGSDRIELFRMSERHQSLISEWIDRPIPQYQPNKLMVKPLSSALVRGLCVFIGGYGEAFTMICSQISSFSNQQQSFKIPPAAFCCLELCVVAIGRCIARSLTSSSGRLLCDWKCSHLSIQIPSALVAIYNLRSGVVRYSNVINQNSTDHSFDATGNAFVGVHLVKGLGLLVHTCDSVASSILLSMKSLQGLGRIDDTLFDRNCQEWQNNLTYHFSEDNVHK